MNELKESLMKFLKNFHNSIAVFATRVVRLFGLLGEIFLPSEEKRRSMAFTTSMIAISAKMAKADGIVSDTETRAFIEIFDYPKNEEQNVFRLFRLAQQDIAGYESYARKLTKLYREDKETLVDIMDGLFHIAKADGVLHNSEMAYLERVAQLFNIDQRRFNQLKAMHIFEESNPYVILDIESTATEQEIKSKYRQLVKDNHPDRLVARGVPEQFIRIAQDRLASINNAWEQIVAERKLN